MNFDFVEVFTRAWKITWKHKVLWIFGILASCGRSSSGNSNSSSSRNNGGPGDGPFSSEMMRQAEAFFSRLGTWFEQNPWVIYAFIAFILIAIALQIFFGLVGTAGLARGVVHAEASEEPQQFGSLFSESLGYFWRLFGAGFIIWSPYMLVFIALIFGVVAMVTSAEVASTNPDLIVGPIFLLLIGVCCCAVPMSIALAFYHLLVKRAILVEDMSIFPAFARGWQVLIKNILGFLAVGIVVFIISFVIGIIIALPTLFLVIPLFGLLMQGNIQSWTPILLVFAGLICYSPIAWFIQGVMLTYTESVWTLTYMRVTKPKEEAPVFVEANA